MLFRSAAVANEEGARVAELGLGVVWGGFGPEKEVADDITWMFMGIHNISSTLS